MILARFWTGTHDHYKIETEQLHNDIDNSPKHALGNSQTGFGHLFAFQYTVHIVFNQRDSQNCVIFSWTHDAERTIEK